MTQRERPLGLVLREDMDTAGVSVRRLSKLMQERRPQEGGTATYFRMVKRYRQDSPDAPLPSREIAELLADLLGQPPDRYVRQRRRETIREERDRLRAEIQEYRERFGPL